MRRRGDIYCRYFCGMKIRGAIITEKRKEGEGRYLLRKHLEALRLNLNIKI